MTVRTLSFDEVLDRLVHLWKPYHDNYLAMYSSWYGGIIRDPALMMVPVDDHLVHRGDGVFEVFKCVRNHIYALHRHLDRMEQSAKVSMLDLPMDRSELVKAITATVAASEAEDCLVRLLVSRGPGGFSASPYESLDRQVYIVVTAHHELPREKYEEGVRLRTSRVPIKQEFFANIKSCNYLPNVLMKKEAEDAGVDFTVSLDERGFLGEGPTENVGFITRDREFLVPRFDRILKGITVSRMMELVRPLVESGELRAAEEADITPALARESREIMMFGTSFDVLPVVEYDGLPVGSGRPGPFSRRFLELLREDARNCPEMKTPVKD
jgi:branched-chain amino acid aminotransferase